MQISQRQRTSLSAVMVYTLVLLASTILTVRAASNGKLTGGPRGVIVGERGDDRTGDCRQSPAEAYHNSRPQVRRGG